MEDGVTMVRGRRLECVNCGALVELIGKYPAVVVDVGTGDGRWLYRLARGRPDAFCLGIDANADRLREVSSRAARKPARGGLANVRFILAPAEALPSVLTGRVDEAWVVYPWGTLLHGVMRPDPAVLYGIAGILRPGGVLTVAVNESALAGRDGAGALPEAHGCGVAHDAAWRAGYNEAGLRVTSVRSGEIQLRSSWGGRLGQGRPLRTVCIEAVKDGNGRDHGGRRDRAGVAGPGLAGPAARGDRDGAGVPLVRPQP